MPNTASMDDQEARWKSVYTLGAFAAILSVIAALADIAIGTSTGGSVSALPQSAVGRFAQFQQSPWLGLYNLDLLNTVNALISIAFYFALYGALRRVNQPFALLALIVSLVATSVFVTTNTALPMLELSRKYAAAAEPEKALLAAAGEAMLARGAHGSLGVFFGFALSSLASLLISLVMLEGRVFTKVNAWAGIVGSALMLVYVVLVTFAPAVKSMAMAFAMPGGLLLMAWMVMFTIRLFQLGRAEAAPLRVGRPAAAG